MKIAVISDIHGNMEALEAVYNDIEAEGCDKIFVLGDYAMAGPEPDTTISWFMNKEGDDKFTLIQGNTDLMIADYSEKVYQSVKEKAPIMAEALKNDFWLINPIQRNFLKSLSSQKIVDIEGVKILLVHGSPRKNNEDILPETPMAVLEEMLEGVEADVILCGHTHMPCGFQTSKKQTVVNVGSVGRPFTPEPKSCYLKMTVTNGNCIFEHKFVEYNNETAALKLRKRNFVGSNKLANTLLDPRERHF